MGSRDIHWIVTLNRRNRSVFFALLFLSLVPHLFDIHATPLTWVLLTLHLLVYPQAAYLWACLSRNSMRTELRNLYLDAVLFSIWIGVWGFPMLIAFTMMVAVSQNVVIFDGAKALWKLFAIALLVATGAWFVADPGMHLETGLFSSFLLMMGLGAYLLVSASAAHARAVSLRKSRRQLSEQIAQISTLQSRLEELARRDPLTGTYNRRFLNHALPEALVTARNNAQPLSLLMIDIDHFKRINDNRGHLAGDRVICHLATLLQAHFTAEDELVCRYGGEEFLIVLPGTSVATAAQLAEEVRVLFASAVIRSDEGALSATLSAGVASFPEHGTEFNQLIDRADQAMYLAKQRGRNQVAMPPAE